MFDLLSHYGIVYDDAAHTYHKGKTRLDSVTSVLPYVQNAFLAQNQGRVQKAGVRGTRIANYIEEWSYLETTGSQMRREPGDGWESSYRDFVTEKGFSPLVSPNGGQIGSELAVYHPTMNYVGRLDLVGAFLLDDTIVIVDVKASAKIPQTVGPQTAAYFEAYNQNCKLYGLPKATKRAVLHLTEKKPIFKFLEDTADFGKFCACLNANRWARELGMQIEWKPANANSPVTVSNGSDPEEVFS